MHQVQRINHNLSHISRRLPWSGMQIQGAEPPVKMNWSKQLMVFWFVRILYVEVQRLSYWINLQTCFLVTGRIIRCVLTTVKNKAEIECFPGFITKTRDLLLALNLTPYLNPLRRKKRQSGGWLGNRIRTEEVVCQWPNHPEQNKVDSTVVPIVNGHLGEAAVR